MGDLTAVDAGLALLRVWLAVVMISHGVNHLRSLESTTSWFRSKGFRLPGAVAMGSGIGEVVIGAGLGLGLLTSVAAAGLVSVMVIAYWTVHRQAGFFVFNRPDEGWEFVATLSVAAAVPAIAGPGALSLDAALDLDFSELTGLALLGAGVLVGAIFLVVGWSRPVNEEAE